MTQTTIGAGFDVINEIEPHHVDQLHALFAGEWWTSSRTREDVEHVLRETGVVIGLVDRETTHLVGFLRVVTDFRFFAVILDVIVDPTYRGRGLGRRLMDATLAHPKLRDLKGIGLQCEDDLIPFYGKWGFTDAPGRTRTMKLVFDH